MDVSLTTLQTAFQDVGYQRQMQTFKLFMFVLVTPADPMEFKSLLQGFDDLHHITGDDVLIVAPSIRLDGKKLSRVELAAELESDYYTGEHFKQTYSAFKKTQTLETYAFAKYIGLPLDALPCLAFFDTLVSPNVFVLVPFGTHAAQNLAQQLRQILTYLAGRCRWDTSREIRILQNELAKRIPSAISPDKSLLQGILNDESALSSLRSRDWSLANTSYSSKEDYGVALSRLAKQIHQFLESSETIRISDDIPEMIRRFERGTYDNWAFQCLHIWRSENKRHISKDLFQAIHDFFNAGNVFYRKDRIAIAIEHVQDNLNAKMAVLNQAVDREKLVLTEQLEELRAEFELSAVPSLQAIAEIGGARRFQFPRHGLQQDSSWVLNANNMQHSRQSRPIETSCVKSFKPQILDGRLESFNHAAMDVVVLTAVRVELDAVLREISPREGMTHIVKVIDKRKRRIYYLGRLGKANVAVTMCRMGSTGRSSSLIATYKALLTWRPRYVIMVGIAFGRDSVKQKLGDVLVSAMVHCYELQRIGESISIHRGPSPECGEMLLSAFDNVQGWTFGLNDGKESKIRIGALLSGEKLVDNAKFKKELIAAYPDCIGGEMEAAGVYSAASTEETEWIVVKGICDWADGTKADGYQEIAAKAAVSLVKHVLDDRTLLE